MTKTTALTARNAFAAELREYHGACSSWRLTGKEFGISGGMAYRIAMQGYWPRSRVIRAKLPRPPAKPRIRYKLLFRMAWAAFLARNRLTCANSGAESEVAEWLKN